MLRRWDEIIDLGNTLKRCGVKTIVCKWPHNYDLINDKGKILTNIGFPLSPLIEKLLSGHDFEKGETFDMDAIIDNAFDRKDIEFNSSCVGLVNELIEATDITYYGDNYDREIKDKRINILKVLRDHL